MSVVLRHHAYLVPYLTHIPSSIFVQHAYCFLINLYRTIICTRTLLSCVRGKHTVGEQRIVIILEAGPVAWLVMMWHACEAAPRTFEWGVSCLPNQDQSQRVCHFGQQ